MDDFLPIESPGEIPPCPVCGSSAGMWQDRRSDAFVKVVACSNNDLLGDDSEVVCPLYLPPDDFACATKREALAFWKSICDRLNQLRELRPNLEARHG